MRLILSNAGFSVKNTIPTGGLGAASEFSSENSKFRTIEHRAALSFVTAYRIPAKRKKSGHS